MHKNGLMSPLLVFLEPQISTNTHIHTCTPSPVPSSPLASLSKALLTAAENDTLIDDVSLPLGGRELKGRSSVTPDRKCTGWRLMARLKAFLQTWR